MNTKKGRHLCLPQITNYKLNTNIIIFFTLPNYLILKLIEVLFLNLVIN